MELISTSKKTIPYRLAYALYYDDWSGLEEDELEQAEELSEELGLFTIPNESEVYEDWLHGVWDDYIEVELFHYE